MTRDQILDAAALIFSQKGFHAASMQDIAEAVNLQKASLYYHISSKQEILLALLDRVLDLLIEHIGAVLKQPLPADEKLRQAVAAYLQALLDNRELAIILLLEHRSLEPQLHARHTLHRDRFEHLWRELLEEGRQQMIFNCPDPGFGGRALLGALNWTVTWYRPGGGMTPAELSDHYTNLFLQGMLPRSE